MGFDMERFVAMGGLGGGHGRHLGIDYRAHGDDWAELALPYDARLIGDPAKAWASAGRRIGACAVSTPVALLPSMGAVAREARGGKASCMSV